MEELNRYQKGLLLVLLIMVVIFTAVYFVRAPQVGFVYRGAFLEKSTEGENTLYSGKVRGREAVFTVGADKSVTYRHGDKTYGPYTAKKDSSAVPKDDAHASLMTGVEIREGEEVFFRGGVMMAGRGDESFMMIYDENGMFYDGITFSSDGVMYDENGQIIDQNMPTVNTILRMMSGPKLTRRVQWGAWFGGLVFAVLTAIGILFADAFFRFRMSFRVENAEGLYPSAWEMMTRYIGWTVAVLATLYIFILGLTIQ